MKDRHVYLLIVLFLSHTLIIVKVYMAKRARGYHAGPALHLCIKQSFPCHLNGHIFSHKVHLETAAFSLTAVLYWFCAERCDYSLDRKSTRLNSSHSSISYAVFCLKKKY